MPNTPYDDDQFCLRAARRSAQWAITDRNRDDWRRHTADYYSRRAARMFAEAHADGAISAGGDGAIHERS